VVSWIVGFSIRSLVFINRQESVYSFGWGFFLLFFAGAVILGILVEKLRPHRPYSGKLVVEDSRDSEALKAEITHRLKDNSPFVYWDYQNPLYVSLLTMILPLIFIVTAILVWFDQPWMSVMFFVLAVLFIAPYGGQRVLVTRHDITVRFGILGIRALRLKIENITKVEKHEFAPLRDFGGYGMRVNRDTIAFFLRGNRGVKLTSTSGKKYVIGSDNVDRLATVISAVSQGQ
jgi:hypothetical protein